MAIRAFAALAAFIIVPAVIGAPLRRMAVPAPARWSVGAVGTAWLVAALHAAGTPRALAIGGPLVVLLVLGLREVFGGSPTSVVPRVRVPVWLLLAILGVPLALATLGTPVNAWDAVAIWYAKMRHLEAWERTAALPVPNYPNLGPTAWMLVTRVTGDGAEPVGRLVFPAIYLAWIAGLCVTFGQRRPWLATAVVGVAALQFLDVEAVTSGYQEVVVTAVAGTATLFFLRSLASARAEENDRSEVIGAALAAMLGMIKLEGALVGTTLFAAWVVAGWGQNSPGSKGRTLRAACVFVPIVAAWPILSAFNGIDPRNVHLALRPSSLLAIPSRLDRWDPIANALTAQAGKHGPALLAGVVLSMTTAWLAPSARRALSFLWVAMSLHLAMVAVIYFSIDHAFEWYIDTSFARLVSLAHSSVVTLLVLCTMHLTEVAVPSRVVSA